MLYVPMPVRSVHRFHPKNRFFHVVLKLRLHCLINSFRFLGFLLWFVLGPGGSREAPGGPGKPHGYPREIHQKPPEAPGPGSKKHKNPYFF